MDSIVVRCGDCGHTIRRTLRMASMSDVMRVVRELRASGWTAQGWTQTDLRCPLCTGTAAAMTRFRELQGATG